MPVPLIVIIGFLAATVAGSEPRQQPEAPPEQSVDCDTTDVRNREYEPSYVLPEGKQVVALYVGADHCGPCHDPELKQAIQEMKSLLACQARASGRAVSIAGVSLDWEIDTALAYLGENGPFDEIVAGNNWTNLAAAEFIWQPAARPEIPQVIIVEREIRQSDASLEIVVRRELARVARGGEIVEWVRAGAPIPE